MSALKLEDARRVISAAEKKAQEIGQPMNIAVADGGGNIVAHIRMDDAWIGSIDISMKKAYTSSAFEIATKELAKYAQSGGQFFGVHASNHGQVMIFSGGGRHWRQRRQLRSRSTRCCGRVCHILATPSSNATNTIVLSIASILAFGC